MKALVGLLFSAVVLSTTWQGPAGADVTEVEGSAYGYFASVGLFGGPANVAGPDPTVTLPAGGGNETATAPTGGAIFGPATIFSSGPLTATTEGTTGTAGSVTSTATIENINTSESEVFTADSMSSTCTASETGTTGSTTVNNGTLILQDPDPEASGEAGEEIVTVPTNPEPNTSYEGTVANVNDNFRAVFNEQIENPDGSITVNAMHQYLLGPTAIGDLIVGQSVCGVTSDGNTGTTTTLPDGGGSTTTMPGGGGTTTTMPDGGGTTTTMPGGGGTTTTMPGGGGTTTTMPGGGGTTTTMPGGGGTTTTTEPDGGTTTTTQPDGGDDDCEEPTDFVGQLIFQIFRGISDLFEQLGISGFEDFGCDLD